MMRTLQWSLIGLVLIGGCFLRFWDLSWHFAHIDDIGVAKNILDAKHAGGWGFWSVPQAWTYAPFQFWFTSFFLNLEQSYREILFWGRFPSAVFSVLSLFVFLRFYFIWQPEAKEKVLLPLTLLACSWENIIYAKQMNNYGLGVLALILLLILLLQMQKKSSWQIKDGFYLGLLSGGLVWFHYQIFFFLPALLLSLAISRLPRKKETWLPLLTAAFVQLLCFLPLFLTFLKKRGNAGFTGWNQGLQNQYAFILDPAADLGSKFLYTIKFFVGNSCEVLHSMLGFMPESVFASFWGALFAILFLLGLWHLLSGGERKNILGWFILFAVLTWFALAFLQKLTLSPTRHSLILLPLFALAVSQGIEWLLKISWLKQEVGSVIAGFVSILIFTTCLFTFDQFLTTRRDPFVEQEIKAALQDHPADVMFRVNYTSQVSLMNSVQELWDGYDENVDSHAMIPRQPKSFDRIAWISQRDQLTEKNFEAIRFKGNLIQQHINGLRQKQGLKPLPMMSHQWNDYDILYQKEISSDREVEYSKQTRNGSNNLFFYILYLKK